MKALGVLESKWDPICTKLMRPLLEEQDKVLRSYFAQMGGTSGSIHTDSFNSNMKALGVLESKWDSIRKKLVRRLLEEQDKVLLSYFAQKGGARPKLND